MSLTFRVGLCIYLRIWGGIHMKKKLAIFLVLLVSLFSFSAAHASGLGDLFGDITSLFGPKEEDAHAPGEAVTVDDLVVTLTDVLQSSGNSYYTPESGKVFLMIEFTIENNQKEDFSVSSMMSFSTWCDDSLCTIDLEALGTGLFAGKPQLDCIIEPGDKYTGIIGYQVDQGWEKVLIEFSTDLLFGEKVQFLVENK